MKKKRQRSENYRPKTEAGKQGKTICVNLFAGAGARKSTIACTVHGILKMHGITSEYTGEYAKDLAWEGRLGLRLNQVHIFGEQHDRQFRLGGQVDCIISDSPLLLSSVGNMTQSGRQKKMVITSTHSKFKKVKIIHSKIIAFFNDLKLIAPQLTKKECWSRILTKALEAFPLVMGDVQKNRQLVPT